MSQYQEQIMKTVYFDRNHTEYKASMLTYQKQCSRFSGLQRVSECPSLSNGFNLLITYIIYTTVDACRDDPCEI